MSYLDFINSNAPATPASGKATCFINSQKQFSSIDDTGRIETLSEKTNASLAGVATAFAVDTYLDGSPILMPPQGPKAKSMYYLVFDMVKSAAGTATFIVTVRFGTAGSVADTARLTFTFPAGTAAADAGTFELWLHFRSIGAAAVAVGICRLVHALAATGLTTGGASGSSVQLITSGAFDSTVAGSILGVSINGGAAFSGTNSLQQARAHNL